MPKHSSILLLRPRKPEGWLGRTAQDVHLDTHTAPKLWKFFHCLENFDHSCNDSSFESLPSIALGRQRPDLKAFSLNDQCEYHIRSYHVIMSIIIITTDYSISLLTLKIIFLVLF